MMDNESQIVFADPPMSELRYFYRNWTPVWSPPTNADGSLSGDARIRRVVIGADKCVYVEWWFKP